MPGPAAAGLKNAGLLPGGRIDVAGPGGDPLRHEPKDDILSFGTYGARFSLWPLRPSVQSFFGVSGSLGRYPHKVAESRKSRLGMR